MLVSTPLQLVPHLVVIAPSVHSLARQQALAPFVGVAHMLQPPEQPQFVPIALSEDTTLMPLRLPLITTNFPIVPCALKGFTKMFQ